MLTSKKIKNNNNNNIKSIKKTAWWVIILYSLWCLHVCGTYSFECDNLQEFITRVVWVHAVFNIIYYYMPIHGVIVSTKNSTWWYWYT